MFKTSFPFSDYEVAVWYSVENEGGAVFGIGPGEITIEDLKIFDKNRQEIDLPEDNFETRSLWRDIYDVAIRTVKDIASGASEE